MHLRSPILPTFAVALSLALTAARAFAERDPLTDHAIRAAEAAREQRGPPVDAARLEGMRAIGLAILVHVQDRRRLPGEVRDLEGYLEGEPLARLKRGEVRLTRSGALPVGAELAGAVLAEETRAGPDRRRYAVFGDLRVENLLRGD